MQGRTLNQSTGTGIFSKGDRRAQNVQTISNTNLTNIQRKNRNIQRMNPAAASSTKSRLWLSRNNRHGQVQIPQDNSRLAVNDGSVPANNNLSTDELVRLLHQRLRPELIIIGMRGHLQIIIQPKIYIPCSLYSVTLEIGQIHLKLN